MTEDEHINLATIVRLRIACDVLAWAQASEPDVVEVIKALDAIIRRREAKARHS